MLEVNALPNTRGDEEEVSAAVISKLTWRLVPFLFLLYMVAYLDRINVGFAALEMRGQLHFNDRVYGLGAGIFFAGYFLFQIPSNLIVHRIGARRWISLLMVVWGLISASTMFVVTPRNFYVCRFLLGAAEAGFFPGLILYVKNWFPISLRGRTVARFMAAGPLAGVIGGPVSGVLLGFNGHAGLAGWQWLFLLEGMPAVLMGILVFNYLSDRPDHARWLTPSQKHWLMTTLESEEILTRRTAFCGSWAPFTSGPIWLLAFVVFGASTCTSGITLWLPTLIRSSSRSSNFMVGVLAAIPFLAAVVGMTSVALHSDATGERRWHVTAAGLSGSVALLAVSYATSFVGIMISITIAVVCAYAIFGPFWALTSTLLEGSAAATGVALINSVGNLGGFFGPYAIGLVRNSTGSFRGGFLVIAVTLATSAVIVPLIRYARVTKHLSVHKESI
jgi:ACS family tartrate transporter-like MFS transporter